MNTPQVPQGFPPGGPFPGPVGPPVGGFPPPGVGVPPGPGYGVPGYPGPGGGPRGDRPGIGLDRWFLLGAAVAGLVAYIMGFLQWLTIDESSARKLERWGERVEADAEFGVPAFLSLWLSPGFFFLLLGAMAVASAVMFLPRYAKPLPVVTVIVAFSWLGLIAALVSVPVISAGVGGILGLIFGFIQLGFLAAATIIRGLHPND